MFPFVLFAGGNTIADVATTAAVTGGVNDNVVQTTDAQGNIDRHPQAFTGLEGTLTLRLSQPNGDIHGFRALVRGQTYKSLDGFTNADPDYSAQGVWQDNFTLDRFTNASFSLSSSITAITSARVGDSTLFYTVDPAATATTFSISQAAVTLTHELSDRWRFRQGGGVLVTTTVAAPPLQVADGMILDRRGLDGVQPFSTTSLLHDFSRRDTGDISVMYRYTYSPYSLDFTTTPPRVGGPQKIHQVLPDVGLSHQFGEYWLGMTRAGLSIANPPPFDPDRGLIVYPTASEELHYTEQRWQFIGSGAFSYGSVSPRLGAGPSVTANMSLIGVPYSYGHWSKLVAMFNAVGLYARQEASASATATLTAVGGSAQVRYPLTRVIGMIGGYDLRFSTVGTSGQPITPFVRQIVFVGLSGYWTTDPGILPFQILDAPFRPG